MLKQELETRLGYEITNEGYEELNKMYMACNLDKDEFAKLVKSGAKKYTVKHEKEIKIITFAKYIEKTPNGCWYMHVKEAELIGFDIKTGKAIVKNVRNYNNDSCGLSFAAPQYLEQQIKVSA